MFNHRNPCFPADKAVWSSFRRSVAASVSEWTNVPLAHARSYVRVLGYGSV